MTFAADLPLPVTPGAIIVSEDFSSVDATAKWRCGAGRWAVTEGVLKGTEMSENKHPAGLALQREYHDAIIHFRFKFAGGRHMNLLLRNKFGNLCRVKISPTDLTIQKDRPNAPKDSPEKSAVLDKAVLKLKQGEWYAVTAIVHGAEFAVEIKGEAMVKGRHPLIDVDKTEIEFLASGDAVLFDDLTAFSISAR